MNIDDIIPYENNARHNERAIPVVAESIRTFGFKGAIVLRSREDPTIVNGRTRVAACKSLGWTEFPDEYIVYADNLSDEEVRALRLADNRTGEVRHGEGPKQAQRHAQREGHEKGRSAGGRIGGQAGGRGDQGQDVPERNRDVACGKRSLHRGVC